jgi:hypothetical protein
MISLDKKPSMTSTKRTRMENKNQKKNRKEKLKDTEDAAERAHLHSPSCPIGHRPAGFNVCKTPLWR